MEEVEKQREFFVFEGKKYEIKVFKNNGNSFTVKVFLDGKPANDYSYNVSHDTVMDFPGDAIKDFKTIAKQYIEDKTEEKCIAAARAVKKERND